MDTAVALVQAYLNVNGYFTVAEYPVMEADRGKPVRCATDLDILAFRFAEASHQIIKGHRHRAENLGLEPDPVLGCPLDRPDMIVGEVKEGAARFNRAMRDPAVLEVALARFGCCPRHHARELVSRLLTTGRADAPGGHSVRLVAFGTAPDTTERRLGTIVPIRHVVEFLRGYLRAHWEVLHHAQIKDATLGLLVLLEKWGGGGETTARRTAESMAAR